MSKFVMEVMGIDGERVELVGEFTTATPRLIADQRARLKAIRAMGAEGLPQEFLEDLAEGNLGRFTHIDERKVMEDGPLFTEVYYSVVVELFD